MGDGRVHWSRSQWFCQFLYYCDIRRSAAAQLLVVFSLQESMRLAIGGYFGGKLLIHWTLFSKSPILYEKLIALFTELLSTSTGGLTIGKWQLGFSSLCG